MSTTEQKTHTPGPWTLEPNNFIHDCDVIRGANGMYVAGTRTDKNDDGSLNPQHNRADSILIAAAPELLAALLMTPLDEHLSDEKGPCLCSQCLFRRAARAAIAKVAQPPTPDAN